ncbi:chromate transporter, putative [Aspergillus fumigatus A1163]|uniref:Chromate transporter, putative n=1 Tax=Aspergillus fumigatus (strain CBS 144.89 / FGSC A1163 / CEA10) TaxID=451804 RepID=B0Y561_ASPFC|nr:chromate transporter, putative [Aspergillus fumigatus A1163]
MVSVSEPSQSTATNNGNNRIGTEQSDSMDIEAQSASAKVPPGEIKKSVGSEEPADPGLQDNTNVPRLPLLRLFWFFYNFGLFAWGGPVAQIALIKDRLVIQDKWITLTRFQRVFSVYQILPGPEAAELCMFFGCLSAGRIGGIVAGLAFILPGFLLMLLASYLYSLAGLENPYFNASFRAVQPIVSAMSLRSSYPEKNRINADSSFRFISLGLYGIIYSFIARRKWVIAGSLFVLQYVAYAIYVVYRGVPSPVSLALGVAETPSLPNLLALGLVAGCLSFGGAYTAIPFIQVEAVLKGSWLPAHIFLDCIAIGNMLPAPLVIFATFVGFQGGLVHGGLGTAFAGAVIITLGMFAPCFIFTIAGHDLLEKLVRNKVRPSLNLA